MQVHAYYMGSKTSVPAKEIIEWDLMESLNCSPIELDKIPYKRLQKLMLVRNQKGNTAHTKAEIEKFKSQQHTTGRGQSKRFYREV